MRSFWSVIQRLKSTGDGLKIIFDHYFFEKFNIYLAKLYLKLWIAQLTYLTVLNLYY